MPSLKYLSAYSEQTRQQVTQLIAQDKLADVLLKVSALAWALRERIAELDINPLIVREEGQGVVAVDALLVLRG